MAHTISSPKMSGEEIGDELSWGDSAFAPSPTPSRPQSPELDDFYNLQSVVFQAERKIFQVLKQGFVAPGTKFEPILSEPSNTSGRSLKNPIILDVRARDFRAFLRVLYPFWNFGSYEEKAMDMEDWTGVLRLAKDWKFTKIREKAVEELTRLLSGDFREMIRLGQELAVQDWLRQGLNGLAIEVCQNDLTPLDLIGPKRLFVEKEWPNVALIFYLCQKSYRTTGGRATCCHNNGVGPGHNAGLTCGYCQKFWNHKCIAQLVDEVFASELAEAGGSLAAPDIWSLSNLGEATHIATSSVTGKKKKARRV